MAKTDSKSSSKGAARTAPAGAEDWRVEVGDLIQRVLDVLDGERETLEEMTAEEENGCFAFQLIFDAKRLIDANSNVLLTGTPADYYGGVIIPAAAMILGARDMTDTHRALSAMLEPAVAALKQAEKVIPDTGGQERARRGSAQPPAAGTNAAPGRDTQAGEVLERDDERARNGLALRSAWEIDGLAEMVHNQVPDDAEGLPLRAMLRRVRRLTSVQMSALDDSAESADSIKARFEEAHEASHG